MTAKNIDKEKLYEAYYPKVLQYIRSHTGNPHEAEDLAQNVFIKIYTKLEMFDPEKSSISTWIFNITRNTVIDHYRSSASKVHVELNETSAVDRTELSEGIIMEEQQELLANALEQLPQMERDLIILRYYKNYTLVKIAEMMHLSYEQIKRLHNKAIKKLALLMQEPAQQDAQQKPRAAAAAMRTQEQETPRYERSPGSNVISLGAFGRKKT